MGGFLLGGGDYYCYYYYYYYYYLEVAFDARTLVLRTTKTGS